MRVIAAFLAVLDVLIAVGSPFYMLIVMATVNLDGVALAGAWLALGACWIVAPWAAIVVASWQALRGAARGRIALILLIPIVFFVVGQGIVESLPLRNM